MPRKPGGLGGEGLTSGVGKLPGYRDYRHTASFRSVRGYTVVAAILDEVAFYRSEESANPDHELVNALRPAMATLPAALLLAISSPYARRGVLWHAYRCHHGQEGDVLVWQAPSRVMNPRVPEALVAQALAEDEAATRAEYLPGSRPGRYGQGPVIVERRPDASMSSARDTRPLSRTARTPSCLRAAACTAGPPLAR